MTKTVLALRHVHFEDLGVFEDVLAEAGYTVRYADAGVDAPSVQDGVSASLLAVLGGPIGAWQEEDYPLVAGELRLIEARLAVGRPVLGICLGAQLMARALGARVYPGPRPEIGFAPITLTEAGRDSCLAPFAGEDAAVLHWHGDTFDLPDGAERLASTPLCENQAFRWGPAAIGFQFHPEARGRGFERWLVGHACEIAGNPEVSPRQLRQDAKARLPAMEERGRRCLAAWLASLPAP